MVKPNPMATQQLPLFPPSGAKPKLPAPPTRGVTQIAPDAPLAGNSSLAAGIGAFHQHMLQLGWSPHTIQAFGGDLNLFRKFNDANIALAEITTDTLARFLHWLRYDRGVPCKPKSYQRRLTTLKVFFAWLKQIQILFDDPAAPIAHQPVTSALPDILYADQIEKLVAAARSMRDPSTSLRTGAEKSDPRPYLLVTLLLATGIKKSETMAIRLSDLDVANTASPTLYIRYDDAKKRFKERKLKLPADFADSLAGYRERYAPREHLFECTARNLEYVLTDLAKLAGLGETVSFESLRWTSAVRDFQTGMSEDHLRQKMGLSTITWEESGDRIRRLAAKAL
ncbi:MAG: site-specific integrase [Chloroflexi bacterium]|nr:site-specific integrase [Chloroflexota bacterium]